MSLLSLNGSKLIVVEDDKEIRTLLVDLLTKEGCYVRAAKDAVELDRLLRSEIPDLLVLDLMLPGEDGLSICRRLRVEHAFPILMLTARAEDIDRILGLEMGADDYLPKPFNPRELLARIKAILRRAAGEVTTQGRSRLRVANFEIEVAARAVRAEDNKKLPLTSAEFDLFLCFAKRPMRVLSRDQLLDWTRGRSADPTDRTIDVQVSRLRKRLEAAGGSSELIQTVRNGGYMLACEVEKA